MRKAGLFVLVLCSCSGMEIPAESPTTESTVALRAVIEQPSDVSKTTLGKNGDDYPINWDKGDQIAVIDCGAGSGSATYRCTTTDGDGTFSFDKTPDFSQTEVLRAVYPYSCLQESSDTLKLLLGSTQQYRRGSFGPGSYPMLSETFGPAAQSPSPDFPDLYFKGLGGVLRVNLSTGLDSISVTSVKITSDSPISGLHKVQDGICKYCGNGAGEDYSVTLDCGDGVTVGGESSSLYIVLPVGEYGKFTVQVETDDSFARFVLGGGHSIQIQRARFSEISLNVTKLNRKYSVPSNGVTQLSYQEMKTHSNDKADISQLFERNDPNSFLGITDFGATGYGTDDGRQFKAVVLNYPTRDAQGRLVTASGRIYYSCSADGKAIAPEHIVVDSHYTIGASSEAPSRAYTFALGVASQRGLVIAPDYIGYGESSGCDHPYLCYDRCAQNALDMVRAAKTYMKEQGVNIGNDLPLYCIGYSQGGGTALGIQRFIENNGLTGEFNLKKTYCGGGLYSPKLFLESMISSGKSQYPTGIPLIVIGMKCAYPTIVTAPLESFFTKEINESGIIEAIRTKSFDVDAVAEKIRVAVGVASSSTVKTSQILSAKALNSSSDIYRQLFQALEKQTLTQGWNAGGPAAPVYFFHYSSDEIVPVEQFELIKNAFGSRSGCTFEKKEYSIAGMINSSLASHRGYAGVYYARMISGAYLK